MKKESTRFSCTLKKDIIVKLSGDFLTYAFNSLSYLP